MVYFAFVKSALITVGLCGLFAGPVGLGVTILAVVGGMLATAFIALATMLWETSWVVPNLAKPKQMQYSHRASVFLRVACAEMGFVGGLVVVNLAFAMFGSAVGWGVVVAILTALACWYAGYKLGCYLTKCFEEPKERRVSLNLTPTLSLHLESHTTDLRSPLIPG